MTKRQLMMKPAFMRDERGIAAVEFALIFPVMVALLLGAVETSNILEAKRKETAIASTVADLVSQRKSANNADMTNIFTGASMILSPFATANVEIVVTSVIDDAGGNPVVDWSDGYNATARTAGASLPAEFPDELVITGSSVIMVEVTYNYTSPYGWNITGPVTLHDVYYSRPRRSVKVVRNYF